MTRSFDRFVRWFLDASPERIPGADDEPSRPARAAGEGSGGDRTLRPNRSGAAAPTRRR